MITLELTKTQAVEVEAALVSHIDQLRENFAWVASKANQTKLLAAENGLDLVRSMLKLDSAA